MDDEASLLPRKLQAALEQTLEQRNDIIDQDSDSESDEGESDGITCCYMFINARFITKYQWPDFSLIHFIVQDTLITRAGV